MMGHMFRHLGMEVEIQKWSAISDFAALTASKDLVIIGPGPGNPEDASSAKMQKNLQFIAHLMEAKIPFAGICLGHQLICRSLEISIKKKQDPSQGVPKLIDFFGTMETVGFYNTFC